MQKESSPTIPEMVEQVRAGTLPRRTLIKVLSTLGISAAGIGAIAAAIEATSATQAAPVVSAPAVDTAAANIQHHKNHISHQSQGNMAALTNDYHERAVLVDSMDGTVAGRDAIMARKAKDMAAIPDLKITVTKRTAAGNQVIAEWEATGTHRGPLLDLPTTGKAFSFRGVTVVVRHEGQIVREALYYDMNQVRRQLAKP